MHDRIRRIRDDEHAELLDLWLRSVRATHAFLGESDIQSLIPEVRDMALPALELWGWCDDGGRIQSFMGLDGASVEALFIDPDHLREGGGRQLLQHARDLKGTLTVDVNEQNPDALAFYRANSFEVVGRSPSDSAGRAFPILHLRERAPA